MWKVIKRMLVVLLSAALFVWLLRWFASNFAQQWLWMRQMGYTQIFWGVLTIKWVLAGGTFVLVTICTWFNLRYMRRVLAGLGENDATPAGLTRLSEYPPRFRVWLSALAAIAVGWVSAAKIYPQWKMCLDFLWGGRFGQVDPIFGRDIGYYVFSLPFYQMLQHNLVRLLLIELAIIVFVYAYSGCVRLSRKQPWVRSRKVVGHLSLHLLLGLCFLGWGFYLDRFALLYNSTGVVYGVGYTADHVQSATFIAMALVSFLLAAVIAVGFLIRRFKAIAMVVFVAMGAYAVLVVAIPSLVQKYKVEPSELQLETPYLKNNIAFTRQAFQLEDVGVRPYPASRNLNGEDIADNQETIDNIPIWDSRAVLPTLRQTQEMRLYYQFYHANVDRYHLADGYHQVLVSARELALKLPQKARTWVNRHLQFTHGYGLVMSFEAKKEIEGLPAYVIDNIPPKSAYGIQIDQPAIYYGEMMPGFRIVDTGIKEFDYPKGADNVYTNYGGSGGVPLDSFAKRMVFALAQADSNILLSSYIGPDSRIQIWRRVSERVHTIAPFLTLDKHPYPVVSKGKLYWIQDAYTVSRRFPYTKPHASAVGRVSYIRNSIKAIVDAYNGSVQFYVVDPQDPILTAYRNAFPGAFKPLSDLSDDLKQHLRYPKDLFAVQSDVFRSYHMTDPQVFYNQEDLWSYALKTHPKNTAKNGGLAQWAKPKPVPDTLKPYYILMRLPGTRSLEFLLMTSFTPQGRDNMIAWMAAKCDFPEYGHLVVYELPKERLSYGPAQVQAMINQNTLISQQLALWDQKGSHVIPGDLIAVPLAGSFLYVEPVYLTSANLNLPQLKRVIVVQGDRVVMAPTLQEAVEGAVGAGRMSGEVQRRLQPAAGAYPGLDEQARAVFSRAERAMRENNWQDFGKAMAELRHVLQPHGKLHPAARGPNL